jgi:3-hydroxyacyl-CoA dehydrogenase
MGSTIAAHLANAGLDVLLLDIAPQTPTDDERSRGLSLEAPEVRNRLAAAGLASAQAARPAAFQLPAYAERIEIGNFDDDMARLSECDWVIEVVVENMAVKQRLFSDRVAPNLAPDAVLSTNTSGLSVAELSRSLPPEVRMRFLGTHFFNPPRYMRLMELIPAPDTEVAILSGLASFIARRLGKGIVYAKDTPNFIGNRIGVFSVLNAIRHMLDMGLTVEEVDAVSGPATARARSAIFRTADLVGLDTLVHVAGTSYENLPDDAQRDVFRPPQFLNTMVEKGLLGAKADGGFYRKVRSEGTSEILYFDYHDGEYKPRVRPRFPSVQAAKLVDDPGVRLRGVVTAKDHGAEFAWRSLRDTLIYAIERIPEVADDVVNVDNAMRWGFGWELGPFEMLDAIGIEYFVERTHGDGVSTPRVLAKVETFYRHDAGRKEYFDMLGGVYRPVAFPAGQVRLEILRHAGGVVERNPGATLLDIGDGVFCLEFHSKMNALGGDAIAMAGKAVQRAERDGVGLVVGNSGQNFSVGANLMLLAAAVAEGEFDDVNLMVRRFQRATMALKYADVPVVVAPFGLTLGGGCEFALHGDAVNAHAETYMGLVEVGVGLLPAGGGTKEMALRAAALARRYQTDVSPLIFKFVTNIGMAKVSMSAAESFDLGYLRDGDTVSMDLDSLITDAKHKVLALARNYRPGRPVESIAAPGRSIAASIKSQYWNLVRGHHASPHDALVGAKIADVITGGDVPAGTPISERYLLGLEREAFLSLCGERKTMERIQHTLKTGKPLRN